MTAEATRLHVTFGYSAASSLKLALATLGLSEEIAILGDDYSMGPIDPGDADQRAEWEREELGEDDPISISGDVTAFWEKVSTASGKLVAWMSSHSVVELCGLHELLWRRPAADIHVVDVASTSSAATAARLG